MSYLKRDNKQKVDQIIDQAMEGTKQSGSSLSQNETVVDKSGMIRGCTVVAAKAREKNQDDSYGEGGRRGKGVRGQERIH